MALFLMMIFLKIYALNVFLFLGSGGNNQNKMISVQVLCGISAIGLRSPENADLTTIAARSFNTLGLSMCSSLSKFFRIIQFQNV